MWRISNKWADWLIDWLMWRICCSADLFIPSSAEPLPEQWDLHRCGNWAVRVFWVWWLSSVHGDGCWNHLPCGRGHQLRAALYLGVRRVFVQLFLLSICMEYTWYKPQHCEFLCHLKSNKFWTLRGGRTSVLPVPTTFRDWPYFKVTLGSNNWT